MGENKTFLIQIGTFKDLGREIYCVDAENILCHQEYGGLSKESVLDLKVFLRNGKIIYSHGHSQHG